MMMTIRIAPADGDIDRDWLTRLWRAEWGGDTMVSKGRLHSLADLRARIAWEGAVRRGAVTYRIDSVSCEVTSINALEPGRGIGTALLAAVEAEALAAHCGRVWLIMTNDNLDALRFYQRRGYRLVAVHAGEVDRARRVKPTIPMIGRGGLPMHDEIELEKRLETLSPVFGQADPERSVALRLVSGAPGSGKSAIVEALLHDPPTALLFDIDWLVQPASELVGQSIVQARHLWPAYTSLWLNVLGMVARNRRPVALFSPIEPNDIATTLSTVWAGRMAWCLLDCDDDTRRARLLARGWTRDMIDEAVIDGQSLRDQIPFAIDTSRSTVLDVADRVRDWLTTV